MRVLTVLLVLAGLDFAGTAQARRFEVGPQVGISMPVRDTGEMLDNGLSAGVAVTYMETRTVGIGLDLGYHRWAGSSDLNDEADAFFSEFSPAPITGTKSSWSAFQVTGHVRVVPPVTGPIAPWIQVGAGVYHLSGTLDLPGDQLRAAGFTVFQESLTDAMAKFGYVGSLGFDLHTGARVKLGLDASYHYLVWKIRPGEDFGAFTFSLHAWL